jgi:hypothetical protein
VKALKNPYPRSSIGYNPHPLRSTTKRSKWTGYGCSVYGWPSIGGMIMRHNCDLVELQYLGFDPLNVPTTRFEDQGDEDEFCWRLKKIGGKWWESEQRSQDVILGKWRVGERPNKEEMREVYIGWPEGGGLLVLEGDENEIVVETGMLRMVRGMEERCQVLRDRLAAVFYEDPDTYAGFNKLGPRESEAEEEDEDEDEDEGDDEDDDNDEKEAIGQDQGRQAKDGKCVCS